MSDTIITFDTRAGFQQQLRALVGCSHTLLTMFDPDFALFELGASDVDAALRRALAAGCRLQLALHDETHLRRHAPRLLRVLRDYAHLAECRVTPRGLRHLTDSFAIGDERHIVRRFHSDHMRGVAAFDSPTETDLQRERFAAIWTDSLPGLRLAATGL
jgi:hypothetical protein